MYGYYREKLHVNNFWESKDQKTRNVTFRPALLLCLFMTALGLLPFDRASVNCSENQLPNLMLLLQPAHVQPFWVGPLGDRSQSQLWVFPALHEAVTAWATPAAVMAYRKADSRLAKKKIRRYLHGYEKDNHFMDNCIYFGQILTVKKSSALRVE